MDKSPEALEIDTFLEQRYDPKEVMKAAIG
jgi:hypothetical protein